MTEKSSKRKRHVSVRFRKKWRRKTFSEEPVLNSIPTEDKNPEVEKQSNSGSRVCSESPKAPLDTSPPPLDTFYGDQYASDSDSDDWGIIPEDKRSNEDHNHLEKGDTDQRECFDSKWDSKSYNSYDPRLLPSVLLRRRVPSALCLIVGRGRLTAEQYKKVRSFLNFEGQFGTKDGYPSYSSLQGKVLPLMKQHVYVRSETKSFKVNLRRAGAVRSLPSHSQTPLQQHASVKIINPSQWAMRDVSTYPIFTSVGLMSTKTGEDGTFPRVVYSEAESIPLLCKPSQLLHANICSYVVEQDGCWVSGSDFESIRNGPVNVVAHFCSSSRYKNVLSSIPYKTVTEGGSETIMLEGEILSTTMKHFSRDDFIAGDIVSEFRVRNCAQGVKVYLMSRLKRNTGKPQSAILINDDKKRKLLLRCKRVIKCCFATPPTQPISLPHVHTYGKLQDGRLFSVYRFILYSDDFQQFTHEKGSAGGCYLLPIRFPLYQRKGNGAVRVVSLTPPGVSTNQVIASLIPDIINGAKNGFEVVDYFGVKHTVFLEVVGYIGDYVAVQHVQDLTGPRGIAPCSHCTFVKGSAIGNTKTDYAYTTHVHSGNASYRRDKLRMRAMRKDVASETDLKQIGLRNITLIQESQLPLHALSDALDRIRDEVPRTEEGKPVVSTIFDPYLSTLVAPDHLFCGIGEDIINANMRMLSKKRRVIAEILIKHAIRSNGLPCEPRKT